MTFKETLIQAWLRAVRLWLVVVAGVVIGRVMVHLIAMTIGFGTDMFVVVPAWWPV